LSLLAAFCPTLCVLFVPLPAVCPCSYGPNALTPPKKPGFFAKLWAQLNNVLIFILLAAAVVVAGLQEWIEFGLILGVVTLNVLIGMVQEGKAEKAAEAIKAMLSSSGVQASPCSKGRS
jgi:magnesium-transporting ATPase (P-type)